MPAAGRSRLGEEEKLLKATQPLRGGAVLEPRPSASHPHVSAGTAEGKGD